MFCPTSRRIKIDTWNERFWCKEPCYFIFNLKVDFCKQRLAGLAAQSNVKCPSSPVSCCHLFQVQHDESMFTSHQKCTFGGVYVPCIYSHANGSYRRWFRSLLLCPLSVERYKLPFSVNLISHQESRSKRLQIGIRAAVTSDKVSCCQLHRSLLTIFSEFLYSQFHISLYLQYSTLR